MVKDDLNIKKYRMQNRRRWLAFETNVLLGDYCSEIAFGIHTNSPFLFFDVINLKDACFANGRSAGLYSVIISISAIYLHVIRELSSAPESPLDSLGEEGEEEEQ